MDGASFSPFPHYSWFGTWATVGGCGGTVAIHMRQAAHCLIYTSHEHASVRWIRAGREQHFEVDAGTVRFAPADDEEHALIGACSPGHRFFTLLIPRGHLGDVAESDGAGTVPELWHSVSAHDVVLESCMRILSRPQRDRDESSDIERETTARNLVLRLLAINGCRGPEWHHDTSVFGRRTLAGLVDYIDDHLRAAPSLGDMALLVGLSPSHFAKKFRQTTGLSLHRFINRRRIVAAMELLKDQSQSLAGVALDLGFSSQSHFTHLFSGLACMTPAKYRKQFKLTVG